MAELDLIPDDYRRGLQRAAELRRFAIAFALLNVLVFASTTAVSQLTRQASERIADLKSQSAITEQQQLQLESLTSEQQEYERRWSLLQGLRAGAAVEDIFAIIDRAVVGDDLWFENWSFRRAGVVVDGETRGVETGYFVIVSEDGQPDGNTDWQVETHMMLEGRALDHQALSTFVRALFEQPDIKDVSVRETALTNYADGRVVSFDLTIILNSEVEGS